MNDKDILLNNVRNWHKKLPADQPHKDAGLSYWLELNERIYDGIVGRMRVMPEPKCFMPLDTGEKVEVEALSRKMKALGWHADCGVAPDQLVRPIAAEVAFELNQECVRNQVKLFMPYLLAFKPVTFLPPGDFSCCFSSRIRTRYGVIK